MKNSCVYPGSFDPITLGHLDIIERASKIYDKVIVLIMQNPSKHNVFSELERKEFIERCCKHLNNVEVVIGNGLTVNVAKKLDCHVMIRGIRAVSDYEFELQQATANLTLDNSIETLFMVSRPEYSFLSSSLAKQIASLNGDVSSCIPKEILNEFMERMKEGSHE